MSRHNDTGHSDAKSVNSRGQTEAMRSVDVEIVAALQRRNVAMLHAALPADGCAARWLGTCELEEIPPEGRRISPLDKAAATWRLRRCDSLRGKSAHWVRVRAGESVRWPVSGRGSACVGAATRKFGHRAAVVPADGKNSPPCRTRPAAPQRQASEKRKPGRVFRSGPVRVPRFGIMWSVGVSSSGQFGSIGNHFKTITLGQSLAQNG